MRAIKCVQNLVQLLRISSTPYFGVAQTRLGNCLTTPTVCCGEGVQILIPWLVDWPCRIKEWYANVYANTVPQSLTSSYSLPFNIVRYRTRRRQYLPQMSIILEALEPVSAAIEYLCYSVDTSTSHDGCSRR